MLFAQAETLGAGANMPVRQRRQGRAPSWARDQRGRSTPDAAALGRLLFRWTSRRAARVSQAHAREQLAIDEKLLSALDARRFAGAGPAESARTAPALDPDDGWQGGLPACAGGGPRRQRGADTLLGGTLHARPPVESRPPGTRTTRSSSRRTRTGRPSSPAAAVNPRTGGWAPQRPSRRRARASRYRRLTGFSQCRPVASITPGKVRRTSPSSVEHDTIASVSLAYSGTHCR